MAVIPSSLKLHWRGSSGTFSFDGPEYLAVYRLETDDASDQAQTVGQWFAANVVPLGAVYAYANDLSLSTAIAKRIAAERILPSFTHWEVQVTYSPLDEQDEAVDDNGAPTDNPIDFRPQIFCGSNIYRKALERAEYVSGFGVGFESAYPPGTKGLAPMNSALQPYTNPPLEVDDAHDWVILKKNVSNYDLNDRKLYRNHVNSASFSFSLRQISQSAIAYDAKIRRITVEPKTYKGIDYVQVGFEIDFRDEGWIESVLDVGTSLRACDTDPDGRGGQVGSSNTPFPEDSPRYRKATDLHGELVSEPFLLDGDGGPLNICSGAKPVYGSWLGYSTVDFKTVPVLEDMLSP